ncbi:hypothetical protein [Legionella cardiaca]|uniref:Secreted protein n=1 Tax=Legionella cardiaca TaxID=1071983 RepID=A0ABY8ANN7_9GAMM|nr:hypothetical protein [Legionella cardiaca]WED42074.1 hypothetical protein PXX05_09020 [Legionella cardiaca]
MNKIKAIVPAMILLFFWITSTYAVTTCFNEKKLEVIAKELHTNFQKDFCTTGIKPNHLEWISKTALPQIMNKSFLGVEPPPNWQLLADEIVQDCFKEGDLCHYETQKQFAACMQVKIPAILLQLGPWLAENCEKINSTVIEHWSDRKGQVLELIKQFEIESKK